MSVRRYSLLAPYSGVPSAYAALRPHATDEECLQVLRQASVESLLARADRGLDTVIGDPGNVADFAIGGNGLLAYAFSSPRAPAEVFVLSYAAVRQADNSTAANPTSFIGGLW